MSDTELGTQAAAGAAVMGQVAQSADAMQAQLTALAESGSAMDPAALLELQFQINLMSQLLETATNALSVVHDSIDAAARNLK